MPVCFMESKNSSGCGNFKGITTITPILECTADISSHLRRCHLSTENISEYQLILIRAGHFRLSENNLEGMFVCPRHRGNLGTYWKSTSCTCQYPDHKGKHDAVKGDRVFNVQLARDTFDIYGSIIPVGSREYFDSTYLKICGDVFKSNIQNAFTASNCVHLMFHGLEESTICDYKFWF